MTLGGLGSQQWGQPFVLSFYTCYFGAKLCDPQAAILNAMNWDERPAFSVGLGVSSHVIVVWCITDRGGGGVFRGVIGFCRF